MAAMLSISLNPNVSASISLHSIFKGNSRNLRPNSFHIIVIRTGKRAEQETRSLVVVNQAVKSVSKGFEGGQMPLYRRIPKLRGIAGGSLTDNSFLLLSFLGQGMHAGLPKCIPVNLKDIETAGFRDGDEVSLVTLAKRGLINPSGRDRKLPLKILGDGELNVKLNFKARVFSPSAKKKLEAAGSSLIVLHGWKKWVKPSVAKNLARADEYFAQKRAAASAAETESTSA
ncbi:hypothetical protein GOBAR_AA18762 [Gossypium barbadense]|uniref:Large ribosomal subunit protein uL15/eL18 domain-containing protein n=1 Tax=Gossypium barbadense TaxID=3634 RepID=A0A2P5XF02_GOSBA|nr:hypothetical protein GOBAR_AA18762 [Gossypium barbadense]